MQKSLFGRAENLGSFGIMSFSKGDSAASGMADVLGGLGAADDAGRHPCRMALTSASRCRAPLYARFGLRNPQGVYPGGDHLEAVAGTNVIEKAHRAARGPATRGGRLALVPSRRGTEGR